MNIALIIIILLQGIRLGLHVAYHGEEYKTKYNFFYAVIGIVLTWVLYYYAFMR